MTRAPFNVLVIPFHRPPAAEPLYCALRRSDAGYWQWVAGGGEDNETPVEAALRESFEEAGAMGKLFALSMKAYIPKVAFSAHRFWPKDLYVIPEHAFAMELPSLAVTLSREHSELLWAAYEEASQLLHWQSNQTALWELAQRLKRGDLVDAREGGLSA